MPAPKEILDLVERYQRNREEYESGKYNETQLRREFLDPFFKALGWDVTNEKGYSEAYKEVIHEDAIKIGAATKAPDYCFRIGGTRKFFLEAKKPSINIKDDLSPAFQLRRYAWSAKLPLSILSDFEELAVYDCRVKPYKTDKASTARILYFTFDQYADKWDEISAIFSQDAVLKGSFDKYADSVKNKKGTTTVDEAFLEEIENWRKELAKNIAAKNSKLSIQELNFSVQKIIDRIIFLRICEDRGIETGNPLQGIINGANVYKRLTVLFQRADERYNSGLFHFQKEKDRPEQPDELTLDLKIDDKVLRDIIGGLYYPESPYEFSALPADVLGQVYEQFLGKVIRLTDGHQAKVEDKPEVKKAGGVFYTPTYIVEYIVRNTVGKLCEGKTPKQVAKLRILDPACGSGSFLIGAYQYFLDWHLEWYLKDGPEKYQKELYQGPGGDWRLTTETRKKILLNNIYGVDIDSQAVEVTKLSLLLKVLEGESDQTLKRQLEIFHQRALPDLGSNIKCGNSIIGLDYFGEQLIPDFEEMRKINSFDWQKEFEEIIKSGGFDSVIGNPPYVDIKTLPNVEVSYLFDHYKTANNRINLFAAFVEKSLTLLRRSQFTFSMIIPTAIVAQESYKTLRESILDDAHIDQIVRLPNEAFGAHIGDVKVDTVIVVLTNILKDSKKTEIISYSGYQRISEINASLAHVHAFVDQDDWKNRQDSVWTFNTGEDDQAILKKCEVDTMALEECAEFCLGLTPYDKYKGHTPKQIENKVFHANYQKDKTFKKLLNGNDVIRYWVEWNGESWISYGPWLGAPREQRFFTSKRILVKQIIDWTSKRIWAALTDEELYNAQNAFNLLAKNGWEIEYLLGILNSRLMSYYHRKRFLDEFKMRFQKILIKDAKRLPIKIINGQNIQAVKLRDELVASVKLIISIHKDLSKTREAQEKTVLERQLIGVDRKIDGLVYQLYGLDESKIAIVEKAMA